ncbi:MAG: hypothetical protein GPJ54_08500 [Candidatus Heimdallarchaeota archaeon]|nr:hypothetical protein [Candidatus Heimdallarchaeota archaeon]
MKERQNIPQQKVDQTNATSLNISIPVGGGNTPLILGITNSSVIQSSLTTYLLDLGYKVAGPFNTVDSSSELIAYNTPDIVVFDVTSNKHELNQLIKLLKSYGPGVPVLLISNDEIHINHPYQAQLNLPINPHELAEELQGLHKDQKAFNTPIHQILNFINKMFITMLEISPNNFKPLIERSINKFILDFCSLHNDFTRFSEETLSIIIKDASYTNINQLIITLEESIGKLETDLNIKFESRLGSALLKDTIESIILNSKTLPTYIRELIDAFGIDTTEFNHIIDNIVPKLADHKKSCFVAFATMGDLGPQMVTYVSNDDEISKGLDDAVAAQITTLVGQGSSYHEGQFGPIPVPTSNNIVAMIWSQMMGSNIKDPRMGGRALSVVVIGFYRELLTYLPSHDTMKSIFSLLKNIKHVDEVTKDLLFNLQEKFLDCFM